MAPTMKMTRQRSAAYSTNDLRTRKFIYHNQNFDTLFWRFDLITRSSSEEAGTQLNWYGFLRWIKEAVHIRKKSHRVMNWDEGSYQLSHVYDRLLDATADRRIKTRKNWVPAYSDEDLVMRSERQNKRCDNFDYKLLYPCLLFYFTFSYLNKPLPFW